MTTDTFNWESRLRQLAAENPDAPGEAGETLRAVLKRQAAHDLTQALQLSHARSREAVVTSARMALRCGALLLNAPAGELPGLLRAADISTQAAENYMRLALDHPEMQERCLRRNGRITEGEALNLLRPRGESACPHPLADLVALLHLTET